MDPDSGDRGMDPDCGDRRMDPGCGDRGPPRLRWRFSDCGLPDVTDGLRTEVLIRGMLRVEVWLDVTERSGEDIEDRKLVMGLDGLEPSKPVIERKVGRSPGC